MKKLVQYTVLVGYDYQQIAANVGIWCGLVALIFILANFFIEYL